MQALKGIRHLTSSSLKQAVSELSIPVPWGEIRGKAWGPEDGHPVLCLHGWADNCGTFNTLIPLLPKEWRYVAVDLAGHGFSSQRPPATFYSFPLYVADVRRIVDALQWGRFSIIGHSMGGNIAGLFSALYPEKVDALVLLDSYGFLPTNPKEVPAVMREGIDGLIQFEKTSEGKKKKVYTYEDAVQRLSAANPTLSEQSVYILLERGLHHVEGGVTFARDFRINLKNIVRITLEQSLEMLARIQASVLLLEAEDGLVNTFPNDQKQYISAILQAHRDKNHMVVMVPGNHHVHLNNPEAVAPVILDFLQTRVSSRSTTEIQGSKL